MENNSQGRKWNLTINNPDKFDLDHKKIKEIIERFSLRYYCMGDEKATTGTVHTHIFMLSEAPIRFSTIKNRFPIAHIERAYGTAIENRDYVKKDGKWATSNKAETSISGTFEEWGDLPSEREEKAPTMTRLIEDIKSGKSISEILNENPNLAFKIKDIEILRQTLLAEKYANEIRNIEVSYIFGASGTGKTRGIFEQFPMQDICRITNYRGNSGINFDAYHAHDVLVFEEFHSQISIADMLNYLDIYPLMLPARYNDRVACFTKVFLTSNIPLDEQYKSIQLTQQETWKAFNRRIHNIIEYLPDGTKVIHREKEVNSNESN